MSSQIILGVPGPWQSSEELLRSVIESDTGYLYAGQVLYHPASQQGFAVEIYAPNPNMREAFRLAGHGRLSDEVLAQVASHASTAYVLSEELSEASAKAIQQAAAALLKAGGYGVKVESAGLAHASDRWFALAASDDPFDLYRSFVTLAGATDCFYSCGMHNVGLPDTTVPKDMEPEDAAELLNTFNTYRLIEKPALNSGETFSLDETSPYFELQLGACELFAEDDPFYNPFGVWRLTRA